MIDFKQPLKVLLMLCFCIVLPLGFATNSKSTVFITGHNHVIELGSFVKTVHHKGTVDVYYNKHSDTVYYSWYDAHKNVNVIKAYFRVTRNTSHYIATYYGKLYKPVH